MRISYNWLAEHIKEKLPPPQELADTITLHAFQVDKVEKLGDDTILDIDVLPNRAHDCLSHAGVAREVALILSLTLVDPFVDIKKKQRTVSELKVSVVIDDSVRCGRYEGRIMENISIGPSPMWLSERLTAIGQKSINNVVDIANFVMFETGQPMHVFDADKAGREIVVRNARAGESMETLDGKILTLDESMLVISSGEKQGAKALALAGIKGGTTAVVDASTRNIIVESANFSPVGTRKTAHKVGIHTDAVKRFENGITPEMTREAMELFSALTAEYAGGDAVRVGAVTDVYPKQSAPYVTGISTEEASRILGAMLTNEQVERVFERLGWQYEIVDPLPRVLSLAPSFAGVPYKFGASVSYDAPRFFDCSSFTAYLFQNAGLSLPRMTVDQYVATEEVKKDNLSAGDIVFALTPSTDGTEFTRLSDGAVVRSEGAHSVSCEYMPGTPIPGGVNHCGLYLGEGRVIHASGKWHKGEVVVETLSESPAFANIRGYRRVRGIDSRRFVVTLPSERLDVRIKEDIAEEIGRIVGYKNIPAIPLSLAEFTPAVNPQFFAVNAVRNILVRDGFSELYNSSFTPAGVVEVQNPIAEHKKFLRENLEVHMKDALARNTHYADLLGLEDIKIFEFGHVFDGEKERLSLALGVKYTKKKKGREAPSDLLRRMYSLVCSGMGIIEKPPPGPSALDLADEAFMEIDFEKLTENMSAPADYGDTLVTPSERVAYKKLSPFPFIARDIALFAPVDVSADVVRETIAGEAGELLVHPPRLFDVFKKTLPEGGEKVSYAFRLVFQSYERTLTDAEVGEVMARITGACASRGWVVR